MRGALKGLLLLLNCFVILTSCEDDILSPIDQENELNLLQKHVWENQIEIDQQFIDNSGAVKYIKHSTLAFTKTQYTHTIKNSSPTNPELTSTRKAEEYWGDYQYSPQDSLITLRYTVGSHSHKNDTVDDASMVVHARYKVIKIKNNELILTAVTDSLSSFIHPEVTFRPKK